MKAVILTLIGIATMYNTQWEGNPLYCDRADNDLSYCESAEPWIAIPVELYAQGWQCGDVVIVTFSNTGEQIRFKAYDAGPLSDYYIEDYPDLPIIADVPEYYWPFPGDISTRATVFNASLAARVSSLRR